MSTTQTPPAPRIEPSPAVPPAQAGPPRLPDSPAAPPPPPQTDHHEDDIPKDLRKPSLLLVIAVTLLFGALLAALYFVGYLPHQRALQAAQEAAEAATHESNVVAIIHPRSAAGASEVVLPCDIRPFQDTPISPRLSGYLKTQTVDIHDHVTKDQLLAEISAPEVDAQLVQAKAALGQAQANQLKAQSDLDLAQRSLDRYQTANAGSGVSKQEMDERAAARDQAKAALAQAAANVQGAQADIQRFEVMQGFEKITAPFDGVITERNYDIGTLLSAGTGRPMFRIQQSDTLRVVVNVPQTYATQIHLGQQADLSVSNYPRRNFQGTVSRSADAISAATRTMTYELSFANTDGALVPGMYGQVHLKISDPPQTLLVPVSAMLFNAQGTQVAIVSQGKLHFQTVTVGRDLGTELEVFEGLTQASQVVVNPNERMTEGASVQTADAAPPSTAPAQAASSK